MRILFTMKGPFERSFAFSTRRAVKADLLQGKRQRSQSFSFLKFIFGLLSGLHQPYLLLVHLAQGDEQQ